MARSEGVRWALFTVLFKDGDERVHPDGAGYTNDWITLTVAEANGTVTNYQMADVERWVAQ